MSTVVIPHDVEPHPMTGMFNGKFGLWLFLASEVMLFGALFSTYVLQRVGAPEGTWPHHGSEILSVPWATLNTLVLISSSVTMVLAWASLKMGNPGKGKLFLGVTFLLAACFLVVKYIEYSDKFTHWEVFLKNPVTLHGEKVDSITGHLDDETPDLETDPNSLAILIPEFVVITPDPKEGQDDHAHLMRIEADNIKRLTDFGPRHSTFLATYFTLTGLHGLHIIGGMIVILYFILTGSKMWKTQPEKFTNRIECTGLYWHFVDLVWIFLFPVLYLL